MGLDMYLTGNKYLLKWCEDPENIKTEDGFRIESINLDLGSWRKHPNLHGFIINEFADGNDECQEIDLSVAQMQHIIKTVQDKRLPHTEGFFFGVSDTSDAQIQSDVSIFEKAIAWLEQEDERPVWKSVIYQASW